MCEVHAASFLVTSAMCLPCEQEECGVPEVECAGCHKRGVQDFRKEECGWESEEKTAGFQGKAGEGQAFNLGKKGQVATAAAKHCRMQVQRNTLIIPAPAPLQPPLACGPLALPLLQPYYNATPPLSAPLTSL